MKIVSYLFISIFILSLTACSSDDDNATQEGTILGKWNVDEMTMEGSFSTDGTAVNFIGTTQGMAGNDITFNNDNTFNGNNAPFAMELQYVINGSPSTHTQSMGEAFPVSGEWNKEGNILNLKENAGENTQYTIEVLNATTLKISADQSSLDPMSSGLPPGSQFLVTVVLKR